MPLRLARRQTPTRMRPPQMAPLPARHRLTVRLPTDNRPMARRFTTDNPHTRRILTGSSPAIRLAPSRVRPRLSRAMRRWRNRFTGRAPRTLHILPPRRTGRQPDIRLPHHTDMRRQPATFRRRAAIPRRRQALQPPILRRRPPRQTVLRRAPIRHHQPMRALHPPPIRLSVRTRRSRRIRDRRSCLMLRRMHLSQPVLMVHRLRMGREHDNRSSSLTAAVGARDTVSRAASRALSKTSGVSLTFRHLVERLVSDREVVGIVIFRAEQRDRRKIIVARPEKIDRQMPEFFSVRSHLSPQI